MQTETIIMDGYGNWMEVYQADNHVYLEDEHIAEIVRIHFGLETFTFNDLVDAVRDFRDRPTNRKSKNEKG